MIKEIIDLMMTLVQLAFVSGRRSTGLEEDSDTAGEAFWTWWDEERPALWGMPYDQAEPEEDGEKTEEEES